MSVIKSELVDLAKTTQAFAAKMYEKLADKAEQGYMQWDDPLYMREIEAKLMDHAQRLVDGDGSQAMDVANLAMFLWNIRGRE